MLRRTVPALVAVGITMTGLLGQAQERPSRLGPQAQLAPTNVAEAERLAEVQRQIELNEWMRWRNGFPSAILPEPSWRSRFVPGPRLEPIELTPWLGPRYYWRFRPTPGVRQSVGQVQVQTGPNRWESFPVYAPLPFEAAPVEILPEVESDESGPRDF